MSVPEIELLTNYVSQVFRIEDVTAGDGKGVIARYRGRLATEDSASAYDRLDSLLQPHKVTALFRKDGEKQTVLLVPSLALAGRSPRIWINIVLFIITVFTVMLAGVNPPPGSIPASGMLSFSDMFRYILTGWPFALSMLGILFVHEMGHYVACRRYNVPATLPYFLPAPLVSPLGTLGAFIMMRGIPRNK